MASKQGNVGRIVSQLIAWLAVPRVATLPVLVLMGIGFAQIFWTAVDNVKILAWASGMAAPFCVMCATAVWAMRDRLDEAVDTERMTSRAYQGFVSLVNEHRSKSTFWATFTAVMGLVASAPAVSNQLIGPIWHWMVLANGAALACAVYAYQLANYWELQTRAYRTRQKHEEKTAREKQELLAEIRTSTALDVGTGWRTGGELKSAPPHH